MSQNKKLKDRTIACFNEAAGEITELTGEKEREIQGILVNWGIGIWYSEVDRYYRIGSGGVSCHLDSHAVPREDMYDFCAQFDDQDKVYEIIKYVKETGLMI